MLKPNAANALIAVALGFAVILAANVLVGLVLMLAGDGELEPTAMVGPGLVVQGICMMFFVVRWARATEGGAEQVLAAVPATRWWLVLFIVPAGLLSDFVIQELAAWAPWLDQGGLDGLTDALEAQRVWIVVGAVGLAPFYEELLFRGLVWTGLEKSLGPIAAWVGTTVLFVVFHADPLHMAGVLFVGIWLGWIRMATGSVLPCIAAHLTNNLVWALLGGLLPFDALPWWIAPLCITLLLVAAAASFRPPASASS